VRGATCPQLPHRSYSTGSGGAVDTLSGTKPSHGNVHSATASLILSRRSDHAADQQRCHEGSADDDRQIGPMIAAEVFPRRVACAAITAAGRSRGHGKRLITSSDSETWELITRFWVAALFQAEDIGPKVGPEVTCQVGEKVVCAFGGLKLIRPDLVRVVTAAFGGSGPRSRHRFGPAECAGPNTRASGTGGNITPAGCYTLGMSGVSEDHRDAVTAVAVSRDGLIGASGTRSGEIRLWDLCNGWSTAYVGGLHQGPVASAAFISDGKLLTTGPPARLLTVTDEALEWRQLPWGGGRLLMSADQDAVLRQSVGLRWLGVFGPLSGAISPDSTTVLGRSGSGLILASGVQGAVTAWRRPAENVKDDIECVWAFGKRIRRPG
jgi:hypothetical protein